MVTRLFSTTLRLDISQATPLRRARVRSAGSPSGLAINSFVVQPDIRGAAENHSPRAAVFLCADAEHVSTVDLIVAGDFEIVQLSSIRQFDAIRCGALVRAERGV